MKVSTTSLISSESIDVYCGAKCERGALVGDIYRSISAGRGMISRFGLYIWISLGQRANGSETPPTVMTNRFKRIRREAGVPSGQNQRARSTPICSAPTLLMLFTLGSAAALRVMTGVKAEPSSSKSRPEKMKPEDAIDLSCD